MKKTIRLHKFPFQITLKFYIEDPPNTDYRTLTVTNKMTAFDVCKALSDQYNIPDYIDYAVIEYWEEYAACKYVCCCLFVSK